MSYDAWKQTSPKDSRLRDVCNDVEGSLNRKLADAIQETNLGASARWLPADVVVEDYDGEIVADSRTG